MCAGVLTEPQPWPACVGPFCGSALTGVGWAHGLLCGSGARRRRWQLCHAVIFLGRWLSRWRACLQLVCGVRRLEAVLSSCLLEQTLEGGLCGSVLPPGSLHGGDTASGSHRHWGGAWETGSPEEVWVVLGTWASSWLQRQRASRNVPERGPVVGRGSAAGVSEVRLQREPAVGGQPYLGAVGSHRKPLGRRAPNRPCAVKGG